jgi:hypothetical protein
MTTRPITSLVQALAESGTPAGEKVRSVLGIPFIGGMLTDQLAELDATPAVELAATLRAVSSLTGTIAAQLEANVELTAELMLETLERSAPSEPPSGLTRAGLGSIDWSDPANEGLTRTEANGGLRAIEGGLQ